MSQTTALLLTLAVEVPVAVGLVRRRRWGAASPAHVALVAAGASLVTHPLLWMALHRLHGLPALVAAEAAVVVVESAAYAWAAGLRARHALIVSAAANATSFGTGLLVADLL